MYSVYKIALRVQRLLRYVDDELTRITHNCATHRITLDDSSRQMSCSPPPTLSTMQQQLSLEKSAIMVMGAEIGNTHTPAHMYLINIAQQQDAQLCTHQLVPRRL